MTATQVDAPTERPPAPEFTLPKSNGGMVSLSSHRGREPVVLYFLRAFT